MKTKSVTTALTKEGLLGKSKVYIQRAFRSKHVHDLDEYQLWASLALELLGKAALSSIHPSLVADPNHGASLFAAAGVHIGTDIKTITAKTVYDRLEHISKYFDLKTKKFCDAISLRRNSELHSGELPFKEMRLEAWESRYWHAAQVILDILGSSLDEWLGADSARAPNELVAEATAAAVQAARERVAQAKEHFKKRPKGDQNAALDESRTKHAFHYPSLFRFSNDHEWEVECPACTGRAFLAGASYGEEVLDKMPGEEEWEEEVEKNYGAEELRCPVCDLYLRSRVEIEAVGVDPDYTEIEIREREYEPDYGNC